MNKKTQLILISIPLLIALTGAIQTGAQSEIPDVTNLVTLEGVVTEINPDSYYSFKVAYYLEDELIQSWCTPSTFFTTLYVDGEIITNETRVLALVDKDTGTGTVFDSIPAEPEPIPDPEPEPEPIPEPEPEPVTEPEEPVEETPEEQVCLPEGLELVTDIPGPTPDLVAPEGKHKLTIMAQPSVSGVTVYPPPGVYYADDGAKLLFSCVVENPQWEFTYWNIGMGIDGSLRKSGVGYEHYVRVTVDRDMVVTAFLNELI
ncbi:MAG: hypothetical protein NWF07_03545 [Candidatus Bathyarchaeota archaeon]|nr:hypothetical protein [Candidatus Bathyarchaeota archaeon]